MKFKVLKLNLILPIFTWCLCSYSDEVIFEKTKQVTLQIPVSPKNLSCFTYYDDYSNRVSNAIIGWDYQAYSFIGYTELNPTMYWSANGECLNANVIFEEAQANGGKITRVLSSKMVEKIGTTWGGCKRYQEEETTLPLSAHNTFLGFQHKIIANLPIEECQHIVENRRSRISALNTNLVRSSSAIIFLSR